MNNKALVTIDQALVNYDKVCREIQAFVGIDDVLKFMNLADLLRLKAKQALNRETELIAVELRLRAERRCGQIILELREKNLTRAGRPMGPKEKRVRIADFGIDNNKAQRFIKWARLSDVQFESDISKWRSRCVAESRVGSFPGVLPEYPKSNYRPPELSSPFSVSLTILGNRTFPELRDFCDLLTEIIEHGGRDNDHLTVENVISGTKLAAMLEKHGFALSEGRWQWRPAPRDRPTGQSAVIIL